MVFLQLNKFVTLLSLNSMQFFIYAGNLKLPLPVLN